MACCEDSELNPHARLFFDCGCDTSLTVGGCQMHSINIYYKAIFYISILLHYFKWVELKIATYTYCLVLFLMVTFDNYFAFYCLISISIVKNLKIVTEKQLNSLPCAYILNTHWKFKIFSSAKESTRTKRQSWWIFRLQEVKFSVVSVVL